MADAPAADRSQYVTPYIIVKDAARAIEFYTDVFGAVELSRMAGPDGRVGHADLQIGEAWLMLADEHPDFGALSPVSIGGTPVILHLYVDDADACVTRAEAAGATVLRPVEDKFFGDRSGMIADPFGHRWMIATAKEAVSFEEADRRYQASLKASGS
jgi:PhnB protein